MTKSTFHNFYYNILTIQWHFSYSRFTNELMQIFFFFSIGTEPLSDQSFISPGAKLTTLTIKVIETNCWLRISCIEGGEAVERPWLRWNIVWQIMFINNRLTETNNLINMDAVWPAGTQWLAEKLKTCRWCLGADGTANKSKSTVTQPIIMVSTEGCFSTAPNTLDADYNYNTDQVRLIIFALSTSAVRPCVLHKVPHNSLLSSVWEVRLENNI